MMEFYQGQYIIAVDEKEIENYKKNKQKIKGNRIDPKFIKPQSSKKLKFFKVFF